MHEQFFIHSGIKGMKWGIRKYQNPDGTYTELGKKRRRQFDKAFNPSVKKGKDKAPISPAEDVFKKTGSAIEDAGKIADIVGRRKRYEETNKKLSKMSDKEIKDAVSRMNLEQQYRDAIDKQATANGRITASDILTVAGATVGIAAGLAGIASTIHNIKKG